jgi:hypothetical protein
MNKRKNHNHICIKKNIRVALLKVKENISSMPHKITTQHSYIRKEKETSCAHYNNNNILKKNRTN